MGLHGTSTLKQGAQQLWNPTRELEQQVKRVIMEFPTMTTKLH